MSVNIKEKPANFVVREGLRIQETGILLCALCLQAHLPCFWLKKPFFRHPPDIFDFFRPQFSSPTPPPITIAGPSNFQYCLHQTFLRIFNYQKCSTKTQYRKFEGLVIAMGRNWATTITAEKIENVGSIVRPQFLSPNHHHRSLPSRHSRLTYLQQW